MELNNLQYAQSNDILRFIIQSGKIDIGDVQKSMEAMKRKELLEKHPYKIWKGKDEKWYTYLPDEKKGRVQRERNSQRGIEDIVVAYWKTQIENPTIQEIFNEWNDHRLELKKISSATHLRNRQIFNRHYGEFGRKRIRSVTDEDFSDFLEEQIPQHDLIIKEDYEEVFDEEETDKMIGYLKDNPDMMNLGILLMFVTGARIGEVVALKHSDFEGNTFKIRRTETRFTDSEGKYVCEVKEFPKSQAGVRTVIIPEDYAWVTKAVQRQNPFGEFIFVKDGDRISTQAMRMRLKRICKKLDIYHKSPHKIRKTYGTILLDNHIDNKLIMGQMGHTDIACTENHYHRNRKSIDKKSQIISNIPDFMAK